MYYAIYIPVLSQGVYKCWEDIARKVLNVFYSKYKKFKTELEAKHWSKHGKCRKMGYAKWPTCMSHILHMKKNGQWNERTLDPYPMHQGVCARMHALFLCVCVCVCVYVGTL